MSWTNIPKPTNGTYTKIAKPTNGTWTSIAKPGANLTIRGGMATGLIMPPTYAVTRTIDLWTKIPKPT